MEVGTWSFIGRVSITIKSFRSVLGLTHFTAFSHLYLRKATARCLKTSETWLESPIVRCIKVGRQTHQKNVERVKIESQNFIAIRAVENETLNKTMSEPYEGSKIIMREKIHRIKMLSQSMLPCRIFSWTFQSSVNCPTLMMKNWL